MSQMQVLEILAKTDLPLSCSQIISQLEENPDMIIFYNHIVGDIGKLVKKKCIDRLIMKNRTFRYKINETGKQELARRNIIR